MFLTLSSIKNFTWGNRVTWTGALGVTKCILVSWATGGFLFLQGHAMYRGISLLTSSCAAPRIVLELFMAWSGADTLNLNYNWSLKFLKKIAHIHIFMYSYYANINILPFKERDDTVWRQMRNKYNYDKKIKSNMNKISRLFKISCWSN